MKKVRSRGGRMNTKQRRVVIASILFVAIVLPLMFLQVSGDIGGYDITTIVSFSRSIGDGFSANAGIYTQHGLTGVLLGAVLPVLCLAAALYVGFGAPEHDLDRSEKAK